ncbi:hypothetical protein [Streptomyces sp. NPDC006333]
MTQLLRDVRRVGEGPDRGVVHLHHVAEARTAARAHVRSLAEVTARRPW